MTLPLACIPASVDAPASTVVACQARQGYLVSAAGVGAWRVGGRSGSEADRDANVVGVFGFFRDSGNLNFETPGIFDDLKRLAGDGPGAEVAGFVGCEGASGV